VVTVTKKELQDWYHLCLVLSSLSVALLVVHYKFTKPLQMCVRTSIYTPKIGNRDSTICSVFGTDTYSLLNSKENKASVQVNNSW